jgi:hypothetical protein
LPNEVGVVLGVGSAEGLGPPVGADVAIGVGELVAVPVAGDGDAVGLLLGSRVGAVVGTGVAVPAAAPVGAADGVGEVVVDGAVAVAESAAPEPKVPADWLAGAEWPAWLACWLVAADAEQPARASPPTAPSTKPAMIRDRLSSDCTCVLHDVASLLSLGAEKYVRGRQKLCRRGSNLCAGPDV